MALPGAPVQGAEWLVRRPFSSLYELREQLVAAERATGSGLPLVTAAPAPAPPKAKKGAELMAAVRGYLVGPSGLFVPGQLTIGRSAFRFRSAIDRGRAVPAARCQCPRSHSSCCWQGQGPEGRSSRAPTLVLSQGP